MTTSSAHPEPASLKLRRTDLDRWVTCLRLSHVWTALGAFFGGQLEFWPLGVLVFPPLFLLTLWGIGFGAKKAFLKKLDPSLNETYMQNQGVTLEGFLRYFDHVQKYRLYAALASLVAFLVALYLPGKPVYQASVAVGILVSCFSSFLIHKEGITRPNVLNIRFTWIQDMAAHKRLFRESDPFIIGTRARRARAR